MRSDTPRFKATENRKDGRAGSADRMARREFLMLGAAAATIGVAAVASTVEALALQPDATDDVAAGPVELPTTDEGWMALTEAQWREILSPAAFYVLREEGTERAFSHELNDEKRTGVYHCGGCDLPVYPSSTKYDSGTGWPSFYAPVSEAAVGTKRDFKLILPRTEVHCARCEGHLGHIFNDGPAPTGERHCLNGTALTFRPAVA